MGVDEQSLWVRQLVLVSAASLLEVYLTTAISAAFWACPEYADRTLAGIREVELIKFPDRAPRLNQLINQHIKKMLTGQWSERFYAMGIAFGKLPSKLLTLLPRLQKLQDIRNRIAHGFGQNTKIFRRTPWEPTDTVKVEVKDVEESLACVNEVIREADVHLLAPLIGGYEFLYEYHIWLKSLVDPFSRPAPDLREQAFRKHIAHKFGHGPDKRYYQSLIHYYDISH